MASIFARCVASRHIFVLRRYSTATVLPSTVLKRCNNASKQHHQISAFHHQELLLSQSRCIVVRCFSSSESSENKDEKKLSLFKRFKQMYRDYWYVLLPVHVVTSAVWFGSFYYMAISGVDIIGILESWNVSDKIVNPLRDSKMGYLAVAYALYKISTPARYAVTLGGTTISINYLKKQGYIKPVPSKEALKELYEEKKEKYKEKKDNIIVSMREKRDELKDKFKETKVVKKEPAKNTKH